MGTDVQWSCLTVIGLTAACNTYQGLLISVVVSHRGSDVHLFVTLLFKAGQPLVRMRHTPLLRWESLALKGCVRLRRRYVRS